MLKFIDKMMKIDDVVKTKKNPTQNFIGANKVMKICFGKVSRSEWVDLRIKWSEIIFVLSIGEFDISLRGHSKTVTAESGR